MNSIDPQRGFQTDSGRRTRRRLGLGLAAAAIVAVAAVLVVNATSGDDASAKSFGTDLEVAYFSGFGSEQKLLEYVSSEVAPDYGLTIEPVGLGDPQQIDRSVSDGIFAATIYEHKHWMAQEAASGGFAIEAAEPIYKFAFAVYSQKYPSIEALPEGASIGIPDSGPNQSQALWLLEREGFITLDPGVKPWEADIRDVDQNLRGIEIKPIGEAVMPRALADIDAGISYVDFFDSAGTPPSQLILSPTPPDEFNAQLVIGSNYADDPNIKKLEELWKDPRIQTYLAERGGPALLPLDPQA